MTTIDDDDDDDCACSLTAEAFYAGATNLVRQIDKAMGEPGCCKDGKYTPGQGIYALAKVAAGWMAFNPDQGERDRMVGAFTRLMLEELKEWVDEIESGLKAEAQEAEDQDDGPNVSSH